MWKSKCYGAFVLNRRVDLHAIAATPARWRGDAGSSSLDWARTAASSPRNDLVKNCRMHPTHWLISTQASGKKLTHWVTGYGTGGTFHGAGKALKAAIPDVKIVLAEPEAAGLLASGVATERNADGSPKVESCVEINQ